MCGGGRGGSALRVAGVYALTEAVEVLRQVAEVEAGFKGPSDTIGLITRFTTCFPLLLTSFLPFLLCPLSLFPCFPVVLPSLSLFLLSLPSFLGYSSPLTSLSLFLLPTSFHTLSPSPPYILPYSLSFSSLHPSYSLSFSSYILPYSPSYSSFSSPCSPSFFPPPLQFLVLPTPLIPCHPTPYFSLRPSSLPLHSLFSLRPSSVLLARLSAPLPLLTPSAAEARAQQGRLSLPFARRRWGFGALLDTGWITVTHTLSLQMGAVQSSRPCSRPAQHREGLQDSWLVLQGSGGGHPKDCIHAAPQVPAAFPRQPPPRVALCRTTPCPSPRPPGSRAPRLEPRTQSDYHHDECRHGRHQLAGRCAPAQQRSQQQHAPHARGPNAPGRLVGKATLDGTWENIQGAVSAPKSGASRWTQSDLVAALALVKAGTPIKPAAERCNIPVMTLWRRTRALGIVSSKVQCGFRYPAGRGRSKTEPDHNTIVKCESEDALPLKAKHESNCSPRTDPRLLIQPKTEPQDGPKEVVVQRAGPLREMENSPRPLGRENSPLPLGRENSPKPIGRENSPKPLGRENSLKPLGRENSPDLLVGRTARDLLAGRTARPLGENSPRPWAGRTARGILAERTAPNFLAERTVLDPSAEKTARGLLAGRTFPDPFEERAAPWSSGRRAARDLSQERKYRR
ncbi:hypothetical protein C7M84_006434 [Penaeus vannamei]|uniref:HTH psq-type domain-containing protein n=1 Tax=Penaeus vannamei TaxID=6689 RepID=A0A423TF64_PENVA|nr:hypothetical protein C7M84_006434 [Penaeus vannamei]